MSSIAIAILHFTTLLFPDIVSRPVIPNKEIYLLSISIREAQGLQIRHKRQVIYHLLGTDLKILCIVVVFTSRVDFKSSIELKTLQSKLYIENVVKLRFSNPRNLNYFSHNEFLDDSV